MMDIQVLVAHKPAQGLNLVRNGMLFFKGNKSNQVFYLV